MGGANVVANVPCIDSGPPELAPNQHHQNNSILPVRSIVKYTPPEFFNVVLMGKVLQH